MENLNIPYSKYQNGKIYKITDVGYTECYIGSTLQQLCNRMAEHRKDYKQYKKGESSKHMTSYLLFDKHGVENCKIELIELYPCESKEDLLKREGHWIKQENCVNKHVAGRTYKEWFEHNKDRMDAYQKMYRVENADKRAAYHKTYRVEHSEEIKLKKKLYNEIHKEIINEKRKETTTCETCGVCYRKADKARHEKSQKHIKALEQ